MGQQPTARQPLHATLPIFIAQLRLALYIHTIYRLFIYSPLIYAVFVCELCWQAGDCSRLPSQLSPLSPRQIIFYLTKDSAQRPVSTPNWLHGETGSMICTGAKWNVQQPHDTRGRRSRRRWRRRWRRLPKLRRTFPVWIKKLSKRISLCLHLINIVDGPQIGQQHCQHRHSLNYLCCASSQMSCLAPLSLSRSLSLFLCVLVCVCW